MESLEEILSSLSARLKLLEDKNETLKVDAQESRATANRAILENTISESTPVSTLEPKARLQTIRRNKKEFPRFYKSTRARLSTSSESIRYGSEKDAILGTLLNWKRIIMV
ncbi:hypothetical protein BASA83_008627 [Batrachochytrium salamandrivorans]|nr:hypothetical protein BASA83_008627 [Batrachochytrium salamandrivorans]